MTQAKASLSAVAAEPKPVPRWRRVMFRAFRIFSLVYVCGVAIPLYFMQDSMIFPAHMAPAPLPSPPFSNVEKIRIDVGLDRPVESWLVWPRPRVADAPKTPLVIYFHGNGEIIDYEDEPVEQYGKLGWAVLLVDFRGYGRSPGKASQKGIYDDTVKLLDAVLARNDIDLSRIVFHGRSLGGGVAVDVAQVHKPCALILESTFRSIARRADGFGAPRFLVKHPFYTDEVAPGLGLPTFVAHGTRDEIVPFHEGKTLAEMIPNAEFFEMDCGHNDKVASASYLPFWAKVHAFLGRHHWLDGPQT